MRQVNLNQTPVLEVNDVRRYYPQKKKHVSSDGTVIKKAVVKAVDGVSFSLQKGEVLGVIGGSSLRCTFQAARAGGQGCSFRSPIRR